MRYILNGKAITEQRAKRVFAAIVTDIDGFYDAAEIDAMWQRAHLQHGAGYATRDIIEDASPSGFKMRHPNEEQG